MSDSGLVDMVVKWLTLTNADNPHCLRASTDAERALAELARRHRQEVGGGCVCQVCFRPYDFGDDELDALDAL